jgi:hypothetical protein
MFPSSYTTLTSEAKKLGSKEATRRSNLRQLISRYEAQYGCRVDPFIRHIYSKCRAKTEAKYEKTFGMF